MCNQAAGLSRCLNRVQDSMVAQMKTLHNEKGKGKSSERSQHAVDELDYLVTFNRSITQAMVRIMQDLLEGSSLPYVLPQLHMYPLFPDQSLAKAEEEISRNYERCSSRT